MIKQTLVSKSDRRCEYPPCNAILVNTFRKQQRYCNVFCTNAHNKLKALQQLKRISFAKKYAKAIYKAWFNSDIPIYKLIFLDQLSVKYVILSKKNTIWKGKHKKEWLANYNQNHKKQRALNRRTNYHLFIKMSFAKFWDMVEK